MQQKPKQANILFYSKFSAMSIDLLKLMQSYNISNQFLLKCIDDMKQIPNGLEKVPTLIVVGINKPLVGREALNWFNEMRPILAQQNAGNNSKQTLYNISKQEASSSGNLHGFSNDEHIGLSDNYAYTETDNPMPKSFGDCMTDTNVIITPPKEENKLTRYQQDKTIKALEYERINQEKTYITEMKKKQLEALILKEENSLRQLN